MREKGEGFSVYFVSRSVFPALSPPLPPPLFASVMRDDQADDDQTDTTHTCCGVSRNAHRQWSISQPVHLALAILVLLCGVLAGIFLFVDVGLHRVTLSTVTSNGHTSSSIVASIFSSLACLLSAHQIYQHRHHWTHPASQRYIERILLLVPVYACSACLGLVFLDASSYFDFLRTAYEAYAIWCFLLLITKQGERGG
jgi:hypothetical protein